MYLNVTNVKRLDEGIERGVANVTWVLARAEALAARLEVDATFTGWVDDAGRADLFRAASVLAVPSVWPEPFGLVGLEAGVFGVPAVAFDVGGIGDWLTPGFNGWLVPGAAPSAAQLGDALAHAARNPDLLARMRVNARAMAERMSLARHVAALEQVLAAAAPAMAG